MSFNFIVNEILWSLFFFIFNYLINLFIFFYLISSNSLANLFYLKKNELIDKMKNNKK